MHSYKVNFFELQKKIKIQSYFAKSNDNSFAEFVVGNSFYVCDAWSKHTLIKQGAVANYNDWYSDDSDFNGCEVCYVAYCRVIPAARKLKYRLNKERRPYRRVELVFYQRQPFMKNKKPKI